jgi:protein-L-isoaspartate(D-aspartate) O-methyltransferase
MTEHNFEHMRRAMIASQLRTTGVNDPRVLAAMGAVPRERFVPEDRIAAAYSDSVVQLSGGRSLNSPMSLGRLLTEAAPRESDRALLIGAATGYAAAVLDRLVASIVALEEDPDLAAFAKAALKGTNVKLVEGPLDAGHKRGAPYDLVLIDGAAEYIPDEIIAQLAEGGRLAAGIVENGVQRLAIGRKAGEGFGMAAFADVASAPLAALVRPKAFSF